MGQHDIVIGVEHRQLMLQAILVLARVIQFSVE
jgi:hypothetical protein